MKTERPLIVLSLGLGLLMTLGLLVVMDRSAPLAHSAALAEPAERIPHDTATPSALASSAGSPLSSPPWTADGESPGDNFGYAVSTAGDVDGDRYVDVVIGAYGYDSDRGRVSVYTGSAQGLSATPAFTATGEAAGDRFGAAVATAGDVNGDGYADLVVGARGYDSSRGRVFVYTGSAQGLSATPAFTATGEAAGDRFGAAVNTAGDVNGDGHDDVVVGAYGYDPGGAAGTGRVYVYTGSAQGLSATPAFTATGGAASDDFGHAVGTAGDVNGDGYADLVVGAYGYDSDRGRAYVYAGGPAGLASTPILTATGEDAVDSLGYAVGAAGDVNGDGYGDVVIGAYGDFVYRGQILVYTGSAGGLSATPAFTATGETINDCFGGAVGTVGDVNGDGYADLAVGAWGYDAGALITDSGRIYVYPGGAAGLSTAPLFTATGDTAFSDLGYAVGLAGDVNGDGYTDVIGGARGHDSGRGRAYVYTGGAGTLAAMPSYTATGEAGFSLFGWAAGTAGDVNGDGYADAVVGAWSYDAGPSTDIGRAYVYHGGPAGLSATPVWTATGEAGSDEFGSAVGTAGDVNGDGYADVIVGAYRHLFRGRTYVYHGSASGLAVTPAWTATAETADDRFGYAVGAAGDVNGDGYADVVVGADMYGSDRGRVYVYHGGAGGLSTTPDWTATGAASDYFGYAVGTAGDVDGDGYADLVVGAYGHDSSRGQVHVYTGGPGGLATIPAWTVTGETTDDYFGAAVGTAGDVNGDGYADVIVGAEGYDVGSAFNTGRAYVFAGGAGGLSAVPALTATGEYTGSSFGHKVGTVGDVNGDGYAEFAIGAHSYRTGAPNTGRVYLCAGSDDWQTEAPVWFATGGALDDQLGRAVGTVGDVNGDGYADLIAGAPGYSPGGDDNFGQVTVYYGNEGGGRVVLARQMRSDGSGLAVQPWGQSHAADRFRVHMRAGNPLPLGQDRVKLHVQVCPPAAPFNDAACLDRVSTTWTDVTTATPVVTLTETITGLEPATLYRWRARVVYDSLLMPYGPWRRHLGQALEADARTGSGDIYLPLVLRNG